MIWQGSTSVYLTPSVSFRTDTQPNGFYPLFQTLGRMFGAERVIVWTSRCGWSPAPDDETYLGTTLYVRIAPWRGQRFQTTGGRAPISNVRITINNAAPEVSFGQQTINPRIGYLAIGVSYLQSLAEITSSVEWVLQHFPISNDRQFDTANVQPIRNPEPLRSVVEVPNEEGPSSINMNPIRYNIARLLESGNYQASSIIRDIERAIRNNETNILEYQQIITRAIEERGRNDTRLAEAKATTNIVDIPSRLVQFETELNLILEKNIADRIECTETHILVTYRNLVMIVAYPHSSPTRRVLGTLKLGIPLNLTVDPKFTLVRLSGRLSGASSTSNLRAHPHWIGGGICFGAHTTDVNSMLFRGEIMNLVAFIRIFLETANTSDTLGLDSNMWPLYEEPEPEPTAESGIIQVQPHEVVTQDPLHPRTGCSAVIQENTLNISGREEDFYDIISTFEDDHEQPF